MCPHTTARRLPATAAAAIFFFRHSTARRLHANAAAAICVLMRLRYMCPQTTTIYASSYGYQMCPMRTRICSSRGSTTYVRLLYMCPHTTTIYASSYGYQMCPHATTICALTLVLAVAAGTATAMHESSYYYYIRVLMLLLYYYIRPHPTTIYVAPYYCSPSQPQRIPRERQHRRRRYAVVV